MTKSEKLFQEAVELIPGGVNSPVRAFGSIGGTPRFIDHADGAYMTDVDLSLIHIWKTSVKQNRELCQKK